MNSSKLIARVFWGGEALVLAAAVAATVLLAQPGEWQPPLLVAALLVLALLGQWLSIETSAGQLSASLVALVLSMALLGPGPAAACGVATVALRSITSRASLTRWLNNLVTFVIAPTAGGWVVRALVGGAHDPQHEQLTHGPVFGLIALAATVVLLVVNFIPFALDVWIEDGRSLKQQVRDLFLPLLPGQLAAGALAIVLAVGYRAAGMPMLLGAIFVLLILRHLTVALLRSEDRADQLEARSIQLASLQFGVLATLMDALALRDRSTATHAAAVARYAKALAVEIGCSEEEQEVIHTAGLLHDIGKFTWSDRVLHPQSLTDEDLAVIHRHPQDGATLVGKLDGFGPVADAILYHHERVDGGGYPAALIGNEIPLASRIVAICSTYDRMTARDTYRAPMAPAEAIAELRRVAGSQLDADLVESFARMLEREGKTFLVGEATNFEDELAFEQRVRKMAQASS